MSYDYRTMFAPMTKWVAQIDDPARIFIIMSDDDAHSDVNTTGAGLKEGFTLLSIPVPRQKLVYVTSSFEEPNRVFQADLALHADNNFFARALAAHAPLDSASHAKWTHDLRQPLKGKTTPGAYPGAIDLPAVLKWLRQLLPQDDIVTNGVGVYATWSQRYLSHHKLHTQPGWATASRRQSRSSCSIPDARLSASSVTAAIG